MIRWIALVVLALHGCYAPSTWGPLAITDTATTFGVQIFGGRGSIQISAQCVTLQREDTNAVTLVWRAGEVSWSGSTILFANVEMPRRAPVELRHGTVVTIGGMPPDSAGWIVPPHASCPAELFEVHEVVLG